MLLIGLGDGKLISFMVDRAGLPSGSSWSIHSQKEVSLRTQGVHLIPLQHRSSKSPSFWVLATGHRPTVLYLTSGNAGGNSNPKLNHSPWSLLFYPNHSYACSYFPWMTACWHPVRQGAGGAQNQNNQIIFILKFFLVCKSCVKKIQCHF